MDRQKIIMILAGAWVSAAVLTWFVFSRATAAKTEAMTQVVAAANDLPAGTRVRKADLKRVTVSAKDAPKLAVADEGQVIDRVLLHPLNAGEPVTTPKLVASGGADGFSAMIPQGMRAISVPITDTSSAGGFIQPRSRVDVLFTRTGSMREALTSTILQDVAVMSIGKMVEAGQQLDPKIAQAQTGSMTRAATLLVTPEQASKLELAKNQGKISLALRNPLDKGTVEGSTATAEALDPQIFAGATRAMRAATAAGMTNVRDDRAWSQLTGLPAPNAKPGAAAAVEKKEPPKPRMVVDVYHGDKHVQEIFQ